MRLIRWRAGLPAPNWNRDMGRKAHARAEVLDIQTLEHYCTHNLPAQHQAQCEQSMDQQTQAQFHLAPPADTAD